MIASAESRVIHCDFSARLTRKGRKCTTARQKRESLRLTTEHRTCAFPCIAMAGDADHSAPLSAEKALIACLASGACRLKDAKSNFFVPEGLSCA